MFTFTSACSKPTQGGPQRVAIVSSTVLSALPESQQLSLTVPLVLQQDLAASSRYVVTLAPDTSAAYGAQAQSVLRTVIEDDGNHLRIQATLTDLSTQRDEKLFVAEGSRGTGLIALLDRLARMLDGERASSFSTRKNEALTNFTAAVASSNPGARLQLLQSAIQKDPAFGLAQIALVENIRPSTVPATIIPPVKQFVPLDRARWLALTSRLRNAPVTDQARAEQAVLQLAPNNVEALARLGSEQFLQGNSSEGERLLKKAATLSPANLTLQLQLAAGLVACRGFSKAEAVLIPLANENANLLPSLASIYLLEGRVKEGNKVFQRFVSFLPLVGQATAQARWATLTGVGNSAVQPDADAPPGITLFLQGNYPQAASFWKAVLNQSGDTNLQARAMLVASLERAGQAESAHQVQVLPFIPDFNDPAAPVAFNQMRQLLQMK